MTNAVNPDDFVHLKPLEPYSLRWVVATSAAIQGPKTPVLRFDESDRRRAEIFQQYANGGFEILQSELEGVVDYSEQILLILSQDQQINKTKDEFDLSQFI